MVQFVSQFAPASAEKACSQRGASVAGIDQRNRTRIGRPFELILREEGADAVFEAADDWLVERTWVAAVEPPDGPLPGRRIECAEGHGPVGVAREIEDVVVHIAETAEYFSGLAAAVKLGPVFAAGQPFVEAAVMNPPATDEEIEVAGT